MDYNEFLKEFGTMAYSDFKSVEILKNNGTIPESYYDIIPNKCTCGSDYIANSSLGTIRCCNPRCTIKMAYQLSDMFTSFDCKNVGVQTCKELINHFTKNRMLQVPSHVEVLTIPYDDFPTYTLGSRWHDVRTAIEQVKNSRMTFGKMVSRISIPDYGSDCEKIFSDIDNFESYREKIVASGAYRFFSNRGVHDLKKINTFRVYTPDVYIMEQCLNTPLIKKAYMIINVCMTGRLNPCGVSMTKEKFIDICNQEGEIDGVPVIQVRGSKARKSVDYVIADYPSSSESYNEGLSRGIVIPSTTLIQAIRKEIQDWKDKMK